MKLRKSPGRYKGKVGRVKARQAVRRRRKIHRQKGA